ncbi:DUF3653 domain-containing protein [Stenotrophomonas sp.]|uniref:DUF3653 domain-containing protein n=1 Tax=Stenotrophomonas sp. TaxID=69392 RepID=UPI0028A224C0|nr:DUF3653 domain-containing protein [Stenotrophomonas sp.]
MRDRQLTGPWAGFAFKGGRLVTPEGRELLPEDLAWLSLLAARAQEWQRMMDMAKPNRVLALAKALRDKPAEVVDLAEILKDRAKRSAGVLAGPGAGIPSAAPRERGPRL